MSRPRSRTVSQHDVKAKIQDKEVSQDNVKAKIQDKGVSQDNVKAKIQDKKIWILHIDIVNCLSSQCLL